MSAASMPLTLHPTRKTYRAWPHKLNKKLNHALISLRSPWLYLRLALISSALLFMMVMGVFTHLFEKEFSTDFHYPVEGNIQTSILQLKSGKEPEIEPINTFDFSYIKPCINKCSLRNDPVVLIAIKSAIPHFERRQAIRETWGREQDGILTIFLLGIGSDEELQDRINEEDDLYHDIVQSDFLDNYYNNTLKTMSGFKWVFNFCLNTRYVLFSDDDMYISVKNLLTFLKNPSNYPSAPTLVPSRNPKLREILFESKENVAITAMAQDLRNDNAFNETLYAGYVFHSSPLRHWPSKWYISLEEYPYDMWPPYATAGAYVVSQRSLIDLYYTSMYTKFFRFDDVFIGIGALKAKIEPLHSPHFYYWKKPYSLEGYRDVIATHGYDNPCELRTVWKRQREAGFA